MKNVNYFLIFFLGIGFTSNAQEEESTIQISSCRGNVNYYIDGQRVKLIPKQEPIPTNMDVNTTTGSIKRPKYGLQLKSLDRVHALIGLKQDLTFHNAHTKNHVGLLILVDGKEIIAARHQNIALQHPNSLVTDNHFNHNDFHSLLVNGILKINPLFNDRFSRMSIN